MNKSAIASLKVITTDFRIVITKLGLSVNIETPYQFYTKGEMLQQVKHQPTLKAGAEYTMSCSHPGVGRHVKGGNPYQHCGYCVPASFVVLHCQQRG